MLLSYVSTFVIALLTLSVHSLKIQLVVNLARTNLLYILMIVSSNVSVCMFVALPINF